MHNSIYIASTGPGSGKSLIVLGLMEHLMRQSEEIGFFRPVIRDRPADDPLTHLVAKRYALGGNGFTDYGCDLPALRTGGTDSVLKGVIARFKGLEQRAGNILCAGTDHERMPAGLEFEFDLEIANNLGCAIVPVVGGRGRSVEQLSDAVGSLRELLTERNCDVLGAVVNRIDPHVLPAASASIERELADAFPVYCVPETTVLGQPTVGEIADRLRASWLYGDDACEFQEVADYKVAAMELPNFLEHLTESALVITPGDRSDIILGSLAADRARTYPHIAGILLTGDLPPAKQVRRLIEGLDHSPVPVLGVTSDTYVTAREVTRIEGRLTPDNPRKIAAALGTFEAHVDTGILLERLATQQGHRVTPLMFEYELLSRARAGRVRIVLPEGRDERILRAAEILSLREVADLTLLGSADEIRDQATRLGLRLDGISILDPATAALREPYAEIYHDLRRHKGISAQMAYDTLADVSYFGTMMVHCGDADGMVSGAAHTTQHTIRPAFEIIKTRPDAAIVSSVFLMCLADRVLVYGDCAVNPDPDAAQLAEIAIRSAETASRFGVEPRVAMLSYSTGESGKGREVDKVREATRLARDLDPSLLIDGPIQYDAAVDASVARAKMPGSAVAGRASVFIFPDLNTGNNTYKAVQRSAGAVAIGPVLQGLNRPVNDLSRGCTVTDIVNTVAITAIQAQSGREAQ